MTYQATGNYEYSTVGETVYIIMEDESGKELLTFGSVSAILLNLIFESQNGLSVEGLSEKLHETGADFELDELTTFLQSLEIIGILRSKETGGLEKQ